MKRTLWLVSTLLVMLTPGFVARGAVLQGDEEAVALANRMLETLGGKDVWSQARWIKIELHGYYAREQEPWYETYWMDLEVPRGRFELDGATVDRIIAWTPERGWELEDGELEYLSEDRHSFELEYWRRQPVVIFHRLASGTPATRVARGTNEYRFDVFDAETDELLAQFAVNQKGEPIKWGSSIGEREFEHVFGPLENYDGLRQPRWGATISGIWRYEHVAASLTSSAPTISLEPPS